MYFYVDNSIKIVVNKSGYPIYLLLFHLLTAIVNYNLIPIILLENAKFKMVYSSINSSK